MKFLLSLIVLLSFNLKAETVFLEGNEYKSFESDGITYLVKIDPTDPTDPKKKKKKNDHRYLSALQISEKVGLGFGFYFGYSYFGDNAFEVSKDGQTGQFGALYDGSNTITNNGNLLMSPLLELRIADRFKVGAGIDVHLNREYDENGSIVFTKNDEGNYVVSEITGDRTSFAKNGGENISDLANHYHLYAEYDIIVIPSKKKDLLVSLGAFTRQMKTDHYAGINPVGEEFSTVFRDHGVRLGLGLIDGGEVLPVSVAAQIGFKGSFDLKIGIKL